MTIRRAIGVIDRLAMALVTIAISADRFALSGERRARLGAAGGGSVLSGMIS